MMIQILWVNPRIQFIQIKTSTVENEETEDNSKGIDSTLMLLCPLIPTTSDETE